MAAPKLNIDLSPQRHFFDWGGPDPYEDNLKRKSIIFAVLLKSYFVVPGRSARMN